jgi:hypothetical protein
MINRSIPSPLLVAYAVLITAVVALLLINPVPLDDGRAQIRFGIVRYVDEEADVICWVFNGFVWGGISCLPMKDTDF